MAVPRMLLAVCRARAFDPPNDPRGAVVWGQLLPNSAFKNWPTADEEKTGNNLQGFMSIYEENISDLGLGS